MQKHPPNGEASRKPKAQIIRMDTKKMNKSHNGTSVPNYCFDISGIIDFISNGGGYTGIQRVVVMVASSFYDAVPDDHKDRVYIGYYDRLSDSYRCMPFAQIKDYIKYPNLLSEALSVRAKRSTGSIQVDIFLKKYRKKSLKYYFHLWRLDILSLLGKDAHFLKFNTNSSGWKRLRRGQEEMRGKTISKISSVNSTNILKAGDLLFLLDAAWHSSHIEKITKISSMGIKTITMVHDLIPLKMTCYTDSSLPGAYVNWIMRSAEYSSAYLAVSNNTLSDLKYFMRSISADKNIHLLPLAQGFVKPKDRSSTIGALAEKVSSDMYPDFHEVINAHPSLRIYKGIPFILCVGTIEIRKNPMRLLQAWKQLIDRSLGDVPKLVFAGRMGWLIDDFRHALEASGNLNGYIDIIEQPSDDDLSFLYRNCLFTVMPSIYEGWGLPVGESLSFGKTAVVSNTSSLPEVGKDLVEYCNPMSVSDIADAVWRLISEPERRIYLEKKIAKAPLRGWEAVGNDLFMIAHKM